ncbi:MAG: choline dehydrogenase-like flavoprotein [Saprospiraceae bacterium]|jgi:choline dehydrogenase-like flavoprotein
MKVTEKQLKALRAVCDTLIPAIAGDDYWQRKASDFKVAERMVDQVSHLSLREQKEFQQLLGLLSSRALGITWRGPLKPAHLLSKEQIEAMFQKWSRSRFNDIRKGYNTLKKLCGFVFFSDTDNGENPNWQALKYQKMPGVEASEDTLAKGILTFQNNEILECDVVVAGSGAGGAVTAAVLAEAGYKVIIVEKGPYFREGDFNQQEVDMYNKLYEGRGLLTSVDGGVSVLAGSCLGGGTTVNWAGAFRTPDYILEEWAKEHDNPHFLTPDYQKGFTFIEQRNHISTVFSKHNPQNETLLSGAKELGWKANLISQNIRKPDGLSEELFWKSQGFSPLGDAYGTKQGSVKTFLQDAVNKGARILFNTGVTKVIHKKGMAEGLEISSLMNGQEIKARIRAKRVIIAAGSIHSPAILRRSGLRHKQIGNNLYLHPTVPVAATYEEISNPWHGPMMSVVVDEFTRIDGNYGFKMETPPVHPGLFASVTSWQNGRQYKQEMLEAHQSQVFIILTRDKYGGKIKLDKKGQPLIHYRLHDYDKNHLIQGMQKAVELHHKKGARKINVSHNQPLIFERERDEINFMLSEIPRRKWDPNYFGLFSAHQMGTCRMGGSDKKHPVKPTGETREVKNLFVADGSAFPSASGANPMLSIQALAYHVALAIKASL